MRWNIRSFLLLAFISLLVTILFNILWLPAMAAEVVEKGDKLVIVPWGAWAVAVADSLVQIMLPIILPIIAAYVIAAIRRVYPWAALLLTQRRVEQMIQGAADYGVNAVRGAAKGKQLSVPVASDVIRVGTQYVIDTGPAAAIHAVGGANGIAQRIFRKLHIEDEATVENTLAPAIDALRGDTDRMPHPPMSDR